jgi:hypothetical protein
MSDRALSIATQALQQTSVTGIPLTTPLADKATLGSFYVRVGITIGTGDTNVAVLLPRMPSMYIVVRNSSTATIYDGSNPAAWNRNNITLRASASTVISLLVG